MSDIQDPGSAEAEHSGRHRAGKINSAERRNSERRRLIDPTTCERDYTDEEIAL